MNFKNISLFISLVFVSSVNFAQDNILTAGIQVKPIFSSKFFGTGEQTLTGDSSITFQTKPGSGFCAGMVVRYGITNRISFETGINYVKRSYTLNIHDSLLPFSGTSKYRIISYEIPLSGLVFIQLSEKIFMDVSLGVSFDFFPSSVQSQDDYFKHLGTRRGWIHESILANLGYEYRTEKSGYFYIGASYHRPFKDIYYSTVTYYRNKDDYTSGQQFLLSGNYLTMDLRYFFHEDPLKKQARKKKSKQE
ncbi:MAG TPA: hypothetical protein VJY62_05440 [Bacteroidia bacterium]|nr:hypothetical protein [Bacteroidia bacterium]